MGPSIYLDYNATAPVRPAVRDAVLAALSLTGNASSVHRFGREARALIEQSREMVARLAGVAPSGLVFTSGGTEANHLALLGAGRSRVLVSAGEHAAVLEARPDAVPVALDGDGVVDLADLERRLQETPEPALVAVMLANNETGVVQPLAEVVALARAAGALVHCDAVQAAGKLPLDLGELGVDSLALSAHKLGGLQGVGALAFRPGLVLAAIQRGGGQESKLRSGTENLTGIAGFGAAAAAAREGLVGLAGLAVLRDRLEQGLRDIAPTVRVFGSAAARLPNTSCFAVPGLAGETQVIALDLDGVAVSAGSACSSGKVEPSHVLLAMGADAATAASAIRVSLGWDSRDEDVTGFLQAWRQFYRRSRAA